MRRATQHSVLFWSCTMAQRIISETVITCPFSNLFLEPLAVRFHIHFSTTRASIFRCTNRFIIHGVLYVWPCVHSMCMVLLVLNNNHFIINCNYISLRSVTLPSCVLKHKKRHTHRHTYRYVNT